VKEVPRPSKRIIDPNAGIEKVRREGRCRACGSLSHLNRAHLVSRGQRGDDVEDNIVPLCGSGTSGCHGALHDHHPASFPSTLQGKPWTIIAAELRATLTPREISYVISKKGTDWLNRVYPA